ncbi:hypothetical protein [Leifsonia shinshuensis]|uniref:Uncharacterized protein n=1 Tax=Leifsonia shinshuensis TaxID=150026 RepID=A0A7G6YBJ2_9MICO|nr:hypothetical protein [Leifsonia shinshuensis]QNE35857.1 hypothetical protein F1C12_12465 [Leifsonia shinshuensis]
MTQDLEARYRAALRWYPQSWRRRNADAVVGMLLDGADHGGRTVPAAGELTDLALRGLAARIAVVLPEGVRSGAATLAFGYGFAFSLIMFWSSWWAPLSRYRSSFREAAPDVVTFGPFLSPGVLLTGIWTAAFILVLTGAGRAPRAVLAASGLVAVLLPCVNALVPGWDGPSATNLVFFALAGFLAASAPPKRRGLIVGVPLWILLFVGVYAWNAMLVPDMPSDRQFWYIFGARVPPSVMVALLIAIAVVLLLLRRPAAVAVFALAVTPWLAGWYLAVIRDNPAGAVSWGAAALFVVVVAAVVVFALRRSGIRITMETRDQELAKGGDLR